MNSDFSLLLNSEKLSDFKKAARQAWKGCDEAACAVIQAKVEQLNFENSWEVVGIAIKALGLNKYQGSKDLMLRTWRQKSYVHSMVVTHAATAYIRISRADLTDATPVLEILEYGGYSQSEGALDALGYDKMKPDDVACTSIVKQCWNLGSDRDKRALSDPRYGLAAACAGWLHLPIAQEFLLHCDKTGDTPLKHVAVNSLKGKYVKLR